MDAIEGENASPTVVQREPRPAKSVLSRFLEVRGLKRPEPARPNPKKPALSCAGSSTALYAKTPPPPPPLWQQYTKRRHGERYDFLKRAMRISEEDYTECQDAYIRRKKPLEFIKVHEEAAEIGARFLYQMRSRFFEREVVDRPVCDLLENQAAFDAALDHLYASDDDTNDEPCDEQTTDNLKKNEAREDPSSAP
ncbi:hypothetical protein Poli38472_008154 [Pythium oligandrum]|uniref:Uncharacterized protein n=1 Tax=Pythium oligandrum TaxID=41045 RepID=A0A8K1CL74_PYTOL|nr:hypothetical protein Poli38472_008154 [Pythium oligandrum]|eukprot:TMW65512.1 hypothetical protein Poli38472_008154 [Pythium oligandrum]